MNHNAHGFPDDFPTVDNPPSYDAVGEHSTYSPEVVDEWPCRRCGEPTAVRQGGLDALVSFTGILAKMRQEPLRPEECLYCDDCTAKYRVARAAKNADNDTRLRRYCVMLRDPSTPAHLLGEAEQFVAKVANDGRDLVRHFAEARRKASRQKGGI